MPEASRILDQIEIPAPRPRVGVEAMAGTWLKTNDKPNWISRVVVETKGEDLWVTVQFESGGEPPHSKASRVYAGRPGSGDATAGAFVAFLERDGMHIELQANLNLGLLVVATFVRFDEPGPYADRFTREFFFRAEEAA